MSSYLQMLLNAPEPIFSNTLARLEKTTGNSGVDVRLIADMTAKAHYVMKRLGLDVNDTTSREMYFALRTTVKSGVAGLLLPESEFAFFVAPDGVVSMNLVDVIENYHHDLPYGKHSITSGKSRLKQELLNRYINHARTDEVTVREIAATIGLVD